MNIGDRVKVKIDEVWKEGEIICVYAVPNDYDLVDILLDDGQYAKGISTKDVFDV